jgi:hypothetical protein
VDPALEIEPEAAPEAAAEAAAADPSVRISLGGAWPKFLLAGVFGVALGGGSGLPVGLTLAESKAADITAESIEAAVESGVEAAVAGNPHPIAQAEVLEIQRELARMNAILFLLAREHGLEIPPHY